jgi:hypothetical protein
VQAQAQFLEGDVAVLVSIPQLEDLAPSTLCFNWGPIGTYILHADLDSDLYDHYSCLISLVANNSFIHSIHFIVLEGDTGHNSVQFLINRHSTYST